jgi:ribosomal RNA-processing protein 9
VSSDNKYLASGDENKLIYVWDAATMARIHVFRGHRDVISGLVFRKGTHTLYSCSFDRQEGIPKCWFIGVLSYTLTGVIYREAFRIPFRV